MKNYLTFFVSLTLGCTSPGIDVEEIVEKYSTEEINYFFETALYNEELGEQPHFIVKWTENITISISGDSLVGDYARVQNVIRQINALSLPIYIDVVQDPTLSNLRIHFGSREQLNIAHNVRGHAKIKANKYGVAKYANVYIVNDSTLNSTKVNSISLPRQSIILEEVIQSLGIPADSYAYPYSIFYEGWNEQTQLAEIDKRVIQLLYEPSIPPGYTCTQFEEDFAEVLQTVGSRKGLFRSQLYYQKIQQAFLDYVYTQSVDRSVVERILHQGVMKGQQDTTLRVVKYLRPIPVVMYGDTTIEHEAIMQRIFSLFTQTAPLLRLYLSNQKPSDKFGIRICFKKDTTAEAVSATLYPQYREDSLLSQRIGADIAVVYRDTTNTSTGLLIALADILYYNVCTARRPNDSSVEYENDSLRLKPEYAKLLRTYYAPELANNMTKKQLENVLAQMP